MKRSNTHSDDNNAKKMQPQSVNSPIIEFWGNREVTVEGINGILEYDEAVIRVSSGSTIISFHGHGMLIKYLTASSLVITGIFTNVEFIG